MDHMHDVLEDLRTVREISTKKGLVRRYLQESAGYCRTGLWYIEGPYARHREVPVPDALRDAIRGIRRRKRLRELVERLTPPWHAYIPRHGSKRDQCSIAYLSNGGKWKLFDLEKKVIWTRPSRNDRLARETENLVQFGHYFNIPDWEIVQRDGQVWRRDRYVGDKNLSQCDTGERIQILKVLFGQYEAFAASAAGRPAPELTHAAVSTIMECAPRSLPARIAAKHHAEIEALAASLRLLPVHGDLSAQNVFVLDGRPWIIDWDSAGVGQPILQDLLYLIIRESELERIDLLTAFLSGYFDDELLKIFSLNGLGGAPCGNLLLLVHAYLIHFHQKRLAGHRDVQARNVDKVWRPLRSYCARYISMPGAST